VKVAAEAERKTRLRREAAAAVSAERLEKAEKLRAAKERTRLETERRRQEEREFEAEKRAYRAKQDELRQAVGSARHFKIILKHSSPMSLALLLCAHKHL
jgi:hypothetical protein